MSNAVTGIGSFVSLNTDTTPTDATGYGALTGWVESDEIITVGDVQPTTSVATFNLLKLGTVNKRLTYTDLGQVALSFAYDAADPLIVALKNARQNKALVTIRETLSDGSTTTYYKAFVSMANKVIGDGSGIVMFNANLEVVSNDYVEVVA